MVEIRKTTQYGPVGAFDTALVDAYEQKTLLRCVYGSNFKDISGTNIKDGCYAPRDGGAVIMTREQGDIQIKDYMNN